MVCRLGSEEVGGYFEFEYVSTESTLMSTPKGIIDLVHSLVDIESYRSILDLCSGSGSFFKECAKLNPKATLEGFEINQEVSLIAKMKLILSNAQFSISTCDVLQTPINQKYDLVFADIPWGMRLTQEVKHDQDMIVEYERKRKNSEWSFIYKAINATSKTGKAVVIAPSPALYSTLDKDARAQIVEKGLLEAVYKMPAVTYLGTGMQYNVLIFSYGNDQTKFVDASECYKSIRSKIEAIDIDEMTNLITLNDSKNVRDITKEEVKEKDYSLEAGRYLGKANNIELINPKPIREIGTVLSGFQYTSRTVTELEPGEGNVEVVKIANLNEGQVDCSALASLNIPEERVRKYFLRNSDILISAKGTKITVAVVKNVDGRKIIPYNNLLVIRITSEDVLPQYLCSYLCSQTGQSILQSLQTGGTIMNITRKTLMDMNVSILEKEKQKEIADRFNCSMRKDKS